MNEPDFPQPTSEPDAPADDLEVRVAELENRVAELENRVAELENRVSSLEEYVESKTTAGPAATSATTAVSVAPEDPYAHLAAANAPKSDDTELAEWDEGFTVTTWGVEPSEGDNA